MAGQGGEGTEGGETMSGKIQTLYQFLGLLQDVKQEKDSQYKAMCPGHADKKQSLSIKEADGKILLNCFAMCQLDDILEPLNLESKDLFLNGHKLKAESRVIETVYRYTDANGKPFETVRFNPKDFAQRQPDGKGGYLWNLNGIVPTLYHQDKLAKAIENNAGIFIVEGEKDADNQWRAGLIATTNPMGAGKWRDSYSETLRGADLIIIPDRDQPGQKHAQQVAQSCYGKAKRIRVLELPGTGKDLTDWLEAGGNREQLDSLAAACPDWQPETQTSRDAYPNTNLDSVLKRCKEYFYLPESGPLEVELGAIAANMLPGDPVWLLLVGPPGYGKTELTNVLSKTKNIHQVATLTEASLLSGMPKRESHGAKGGLLRELGEFGILLVKDFGSVLSLTRESRGPILAALREVYDGAWTRYVGSDGGRILSWAGKAGLVGGATPSIDQHYQVMATLGERFCYYRLPDEEQTNKAKKALDHSGHESKMRAELSTLVAGLFDHLDLSIPIIFSEGERNKLVALALFATRCRSAVERDTYQTREIQLIPGAESPTRLVKVLAQLLRGMQILGITKSRAWELVEKVALDSMPAIRHKVIKAMLTENGNVITSQLAAKLGYPTNTTRRTLEDLACYGITDRISQGEGHADLWNLTDWTRKTYEAATVGVPEILNTDISLIPNINTKNNLEVSISGTPSLDYPLHCHACGSDEFWTTPDGRLLCSTCHPSPDGEK